MAYNGYLIRVIDVNNEYNYFDIPLHDVLEKTYKMTYSVIDFDSTRNGAGKLIRNALRHKVPHCTIEVKPLDNAELAYIFSNIQSRYTIAKEKKVKLSVYIPEYNNYVTMDFYLPDIDITIRHIENNTKVLYEKFVLEFIGY